MRLSETAISVRSGACVPRQRTRGTCNRFRAAASHAPPGRPKNAGNSGSCCSGWRTGGGGQGGRVAAVAPFRVEMAVLAHQHHLRVVAVRAELLRRIDGEQHGFVLAPVRPVLLVIEFDRPLVVMLDDEIACVGHGLRLRVLPSTRGRKGMFPGQSVDFKTLTERTMQPRLCAVHMLVMRMA